MTHQHYFVFRDYQQLIDDLHIFFVKKCFLQFLFQDAFEGVVTELRKELNAAQQDMITSLCVDISLERLNLLLEILFECIMLTITFPKRTDDDNDVDMTNIS